MTTKDYEQNLLNFLDNNDIETGLDLDNNSLLLVYNNKTYELIEKLKDTAIKLKDKGYKLNEFMEYFEKLNLDNLEYQENFVHCSCCGSYARHEYCGVNDQYYIDDKTCECLCKDCFNIDNYIDYLIRNKNNQCNALLSDIQIENNNYIILKDYEFINDFYGGKQTDKKLLQEKLKGINYFYYLHVAHMFGTYYTIAVSKEDYETAINILENNFSEFKN